jgi:hypothetical protein
MTIMTKSELVTSVFCFEICEASGLALIGKFGYR